MSDFVGNMARARIAEQLIEELVKTPRALNPAEAQLLARKASEWRHLSAHFDVKVRDPEKVPYLKRELELHPNGDCPFCGQNVVVERPATESRA